MTLLFRTQSTHKSFMPYAKTRSIVGQSSHARFNLEVAYVIELTQSPSGNNNSLRNSSIIGLVG